MRRLAIPILLLALVALPALAQNPTGTITGTVSDAQGPLPGVSVTVTSQSLQGTRSAVSGVDGDYIFKFLPPGEYKVRFELAGFQTLDTTVKISAAQTTPVNAVMPQAAALAEELTVTGSYETISTNQEVSTTIESSLVDKLPINRTIAGAIALVPTVTANGPGQNFTIAGAQSFESLYLVNGVVVNENLRGQALPLFIEDAIEETTTTTSGVSAEYGRFAGGVVNTLTKSGGNELHGSFRTSFTNADWAALRPGEAEATDKINKVYEATVGGYAWKDHIWFFGAARDTGDSVVSTQTGITNIPFDQITSQQRYEGKGTFALTTNHRVIGSYIEIKQTATNGAFPNAATIMDVTSLSDREDPQVLVTGNYTGVLSDSFFVEAQYSKRDFTIAKGSGAKSTDRVFGTLLRDQSRSNRRFWTPTFCGVCGDETRNNEDWILKASYFLGTDKLGSHDLVFGYDEFSDLIKQDNHQSGSDFRVLVSGTYLNGTTLTPIVRPRGQTRATYIQWWPILQLSQGSDFTTKSLFLNDRWRLNNNLAFNIGVRYDKNHGTNQAGATVAKDSRVSPRLGMTWDIAGDGKTIVTASLAQYVTAIANGVGDSTSSAGSPSFYEWWYTGPEINTDPNNTVPTDEVLRRVWAWFDSVGGTANTELYRQPADIAGSTTQIRGSLGSPYAEELAVGATRRLSANTMVRLDYMHREFKDLYTTRTDMSTGTVTLPTGAVANVNLVVNSNTAERQFDAVTVQASHRQGILNLGGSYTWSQTIGNTLGETEASGPVADGLLQYPEYIQLRWNSPRGYLGTDQRHAVRLWGVVDILNTKHNRLSAGFLQQFNSGTPYEAIGRIDSTQYVQNPGYENPPDQGVFYFYSRRGAYRTDDIWRTDLTLNYSFVVPAWGKQIELYLAPEVLNVFNAQGVINVDTTVEDSVTHPTELQAFNPFTTKPVEGVNWRKGEDFGRPLAPADYQLPRTFRFSVGIRF